MVYKTLLVGGTFDNFHIGHQYFLWNAKQCCESLFVVVARDNTVKRLKQKTPRRSEKQRIQRIREENIPACNPLLGRKDGDFLALIKEVNPEAIYLGYDQQIKEQDLIKHFPHIKIFRTKAYAPDFFKSSKF